MKSSRKGLAEFFAVIVILGILIALVFGITSCQRAYIESNYPETSFSVNGEITKYMSIEDYKEWQKGYGSTVEIVRIIPINDRVDGETGTFIVTYKAR